jgi:hypothetical protein
VRKQARTSFFEKKEAKKLLRDGTVLAGPAIARCTHHAGACRYPRRPASPQTPFSICTAKSPQPQAKSNKGFSLLFFKKDVLSPAASRA